MSEYIEINKDERDDRNKRLVIRNGHLPERKIQTGLAPIFLKQARIRDRREGEKFTSAILPPYLRRVPSIETVIPALYLKGVSTGNFSEALEAILGKDARGLSPTNIVRFKKCWEEEYTPLSLKNALSDN